MDSSPVAAQEISWSSKCRAFKAGDSLSRGGPRKIQNKEITSEVEKKIVSKDLAKDRNNQKDGK